MLKKRVSATVLVKNGITVQSIKFNKYLPIGKPEISIDYLNQWGIDEIIFLDMSATKNKNEPNYEIINLASKKCFVPLTVGGGISKLEHIQKLLNSGADKVSLNYAAITQPDLISKAAKIFGDQCVVVNIDSIITLEGNKVYDYVNKKIINKSPGDFAKEMVERGAGEIVINSVDRDGTYIGYDIPLINSVCEKVVVPVLCSGGAKNANDFIEVFKRTNVSGAIAANFFHFYEHSVNITKSIISKHNNIRTDSYQNYFENSFDSDCRLLKKSDKELEEMLFIRINKEII